MRPLITHKLLTHQLKVLKYEYDRWQYDEAVTHQVQVLKLPENDSPEYDRWQYAGAVTHQVQVLKGYHCWYTFQISGEHLQTQNGHIFMSEWTIVIAMMFLSNFCVNWVSWKPKTPFIKHTYFYVLRIFRNYFLCVCAIECTYTESWHGKIRSCVEISNINGHWEDMKYGL